MKLNASAVFTGFAALLLLCSPPSRAAPDETPESREPVIAQCMKDKACSCKDLGGDVYDKGAIVRCIFDGLPVASTYDYFKKHHTPHLAKMLADQLPERNKTVVKKDPNTPTESVTVQYAVHERTGKRKILMDFTYGGLGYTFTPRGTGTSLDFIYLSYN